MWLKCRFRFKLKGLTIVWCSGLHIYLTNKRSLALILEETRIPLRLRHEEHPVYKSAKSHVNKGAAESSFLL